MCCTAHFGTWLDALEQRQHLRFDTVQGVPRLRGSTLRSEDLRGGASLVIAALCAEGESVIFDPGHIDRGYDGLDTTLQSLGAQLEKTK